MSKGENYMEIEKLKAVVLSLAETDFKTARPSDYNDQIKSARLIWTELYGERDFDDPEWDFK